MTTATDIKNVCCVALELSKTAWLCAVLETMRKWGVAADGFHFRG